MIRKIIHIDEGRCNGCGLCAKACHEGAIEIIDGKARLTRENHCDGLGDCLPGCPTGAISFEEREAPAYDETAVQAHKLERQTSQAVSTGCPGATARQLRASAVPAQAGTQGEKRRSELMQWPTQIKLMLAKAPYYDGAKLLIAADCTAFAYASMHEDFIRGHITMNGCPKLDAVDYSEKLTHIFAENNIQEVTVVRMEVPCCGGLELAAKRALQASGKAVPLRVVVISIHGEIMR